MEADIKAAPDCLAAHKLHQACAWGSSGDEFMSEDVIDKCETGFLDRLTAKQKRLYQKRIGACSDRYPVTEEGGSIQIYLSWMCDEDLAATYFKAAKAGKLWERRAGGCPTYLSELIVRSGRLDHPKCETSAAFPTRDHRAA